MVIRALRGASVLPDEEPTNDDPPESSSSEEGEAAPTEPRGGGHYNLRERIVEPDRFLYQVLICTVIRTIPLLA